jgi:hypothetical protein
MRKLILTTTLIIAMTTIGAAPTMSEEQAIQRTIETFTKGADKRDVRALETVLHPSFRVVFAIEGSKNPAAVLTRAEYLSMLQEGKIGGKERKLEVDTTKVMGVFGFARVHLDAPGEKFDAELALVRESSGAWKIVHDTTLLTVRAKN